MLNAMTQGNDGSLSTIHSRSARDVFGRISTYAQQAHNLSHDVVHEMIAGAIDFVVYVSQDRVTGRRTVQTILEVNGYDAQAGVAASEIFAPGHEGNAVRVPDIAITRSAQLVAAGWQPRNGPTENRWSA